MKKMYFINVIAVLMMLPVMVMSQKTKDVQISTYKMLEFNGCDAKQTKSGLTIEVEPLSPKVTYNHSELFSFTSDDVKGLTNANLLYQPYQGKMYEYTFGAGNYWLVVMKVKITNNTGHVLKMSDARIYLRIEGEDPIKPVTKLGDPTLVDYENPAGSGNFIKLPKSAIDQDKSLIQWSTGMFAKWDSERKKGLISFDYPLGLPSQIIAVNKKNYKLISDVDVEILPDDSYYGILLFPITISNTDMSLKLYEFVTKTDAAGTPTEKTNFDFKFKGVDGKSWYDRNLNIWNPGEPSSPKEYYDKEQKMWILGIPNK
jgi:hypothetical protein